MARSPLLNLRPFSYPMFSLSLALLCIAMMALFGMVILLPIYLQTIRGVESLPTGLMLLPGGLLMGVLGPAVGRIFDRYGPKALTLLGCGPAHRDAVALQPGAAGDAAVAAGRLHVVMMVGLACLFTPSFTTGLNPLPPQLYSHGSAILATLQQVAGAAGTALLIALMSGRAAELVRSGVGGERRAARRHPARLHGGCGDQRRRHRVRRLHAQPEAGQGQPGTASLILMLHGR